MTKTEILKSFDELIEKLNKLLTELNQQGSDYIEQHQYLETKEIITKAEMVTSLQKKLNALKGEWLGLDLPPVVTTPSSEDDKPKVSPETERQFRSHSHTESKDFRVPILQALVNLGGSATRKLVFKELEKIMGDRLSENDKKILPSRKSMTRWQKNAANARNALLKDGYITVIPEKGIWNLTEKGSAFLIEFNNK